MNARDKEESMTLEILEAIGDGEQVSQRHLAGRLGVALGLTNSYLKRCIKKGFVKIQTAPANRYLYYLTPRGFSEKSRLTASYLSISLSYYQNAVSSCDRVFSECLDNGWQNVMLVGDSDLSEIAALRAKLQGINTSSIAIVNEPVDSFDGYVVVDLTDPANAYLKLIRVVGKENVVVPDILGMN